MRNLEDMVGKTFVEVDVGGVDNAFFVFHTASGEKYRFIHHQDCCENVDLIDFDYDDLQLLLNSPILLAEERSLENERPEGWYEDDAEQWTFYCLATVKGHVDIRFFGSSNGYYGVEVDVEKWDPNFEVKWMNGITKKGRWVQIPKPSILKYDPTQQGDKDEDI